MSQLDRVNKMLHSIGLLLKFIVYIPLVLPISGSLETYFNEKLHYWYRDICGGTLTFEMPFSTSMGQLDWFTFLLFSLCFGFLLPLDSFSCGLSHHCKYVLTNFQWLPTLDNSLILLVPGISDPRLCD